MKNKELDVCIIGSGAGGAVVAKELSQAGMSVVVLEAGTKYNPYRDYIMHRNNWEILAQDIFKPDDPRKELYTVDKNSIPFRLKRVKAVGGTTLHYEMVSFRFHESDFKIRTLDGVGEDWPIEYTDLEKHYEKAEIELGVSGLNDNPWAVPRGTYPNPPFKFSCATQIIKEGCNKLGIKVLHAPLANNSRIYDGRPACNYCGGCTVGCMTGSKASVDVTYLRKAEKTGRVEIRANSPAREITIDSKGKVKSVIYFDPQGNEHEQKARIIIVSGNAVETPRLLLNSKSSLFPNGLANSSGLVGKNFMSHIVFTARALFPQQVDRYKGPVVDAIIQDFYETSSKNSFVRGFTMYLYGVGGPVAFARGVPGFGITHKDYMRKYFGHTAGLVAVGEELSNDNNTITIDPDVVDYWDIPVARVHKEITQNELSMLESMQKRCLEILETAGGDKINYDINVQTGSGHYMGTCRMGNNKSKSVLNSFCQSHDVKNLFCVDGSCFVSGSGASPTLTIQALAHRSADYIIDQAKKGNL
ncbi:MAG TPA: GMC family oxidoreductase [Thermodesulfobacteriota bacterium]|nr:GMC family oxidoreductase [Thermodesulfobacteriota bacterium]